MLDDLLKRCRRASFGALLLIGVLAVMGMGRLHDLTEEAGRNAIAIDFVLREVDTTRGMLADCYLLNRARKAGHQERSTEIRKSLDGRFQGRLKPQLLDTLDEAGDTASLIGNTIESCDSARSRLAAAIRNLAELPSQAAHTATERRATQNVESAANRHIATLRKLSDILADRSAVIRREAGIIHSLLVGFIVAVLVLAAVVLVEPPLRQIQRACELIQSRNRELDAARETAETALARAQSLRLAVRQNALILLANAEGHIQEVDTSWADLLEVNVANLIGKSIMAVCFPTLPPGERRLLLEAVQRGDPLRRDTPIQSPRGDTRWFEITLAAVTPSSGEARQLVALGFDVTSRIELTEQLLEQADLLEEQHADLASRAGLLERSRTDAEQASRLKSEFLARTSHEIRTPMAAILGYADLLRDELSDAKAAPPTIRHVETIRQNGQYLLNLVNDLLDLSKIEAGRLTLEILSCRPRKILDEVQALLAVRAS